MMSIDEQLSVLIKTQSAATMTIPSGAAGDVVTFNIGRTNLRNLKGDKIGVAGDTSIVLNTAGTMSGTETKAKDFNASSSNGDYWINYRTGLVTLKKGTTGTSADIDYKYAELETSGGSTGLVSQNNVWTGTNTFQNTVTYDTRIILSGNQSFTAASGNAYAYHSNTLGLVMYGEGSTYDVLMANKSGGTVFSVPTGTVNMEFAGNATFTSSLTQIGTGTSDGSDNKAITIFGGGVYGTTRGSGVALIGNEYASIGGDLELLAGDSAISGMIKFYVGDGSGTPVLAGSFSRTTKNFNTYGNIITTGSVTSIYNTVTTSGSTTLTDITRGLTIPGNLVTSAYVDSAYTSLLVGASSTDNATKPKVGIFMKYSGVGTQLHFGTSQDYATGVTNSDFYLDHFGKVFLNACTTNSASLNIPNGTAPTSAVLGDIWASSNSLKYYNGTATHFLWMGTTDVKTTAGAPYTNDGYVPVNIGGVTVKIMTTA